MADKRVRLWYDPEGDYLEVALEQREGYFRETDDERVMVKVDAQGDLLGFSILRISSVKDAPLELVIQEPPTTPQPAGQGLKIFVGNLSSEITDEERTLLRRQPPSKP